MTALFEYWSEICVPGEFADPLYSGVIVFFHVDQFCFRNEAVFDDPFAHLPDTVKFLLEPEPLGSLISFVTARCRMSLRLSHLGDMHQSRDMMLARYLCRGRIRFEQRGIIPAAHLIEIIAARTFRTALEPPHNFVNVFLDHLISVGHGDTIAIIIDGDDRGRSQNADGIDRFPEHAFSRRRVANACERDFVTILRELIELLEFSESAIED